MEQLLLHDKPPFGAVLAGDRKTFRPRGRTESKALLGSEKRPVEILLGELEQAFKSFQEATVLLSGEAYVIVSVLPPLLKGLQKATHQASLEPSFVNSFQTAAAQETSSR